MHHLEFFKSIGEGFCVSKVKLNWLATRFRYSSCVVVMNFVSSPMKKFRDIICV